MLQILPIMPLTSPGTFEIDTFGTHYHGVPRGTGLATNGFVIGATTTTSDFVNTITYGFSETRPVNFNVNWYIKY